MKNVYKIIEKILQLKKMHNLLFDKEQGKITVIGNDNLFK